MRTPQPLLGIDREGIPLVAQLRRRKGSIALCAALLLLLQSALTAWATSAMPASPLLDAFGNPLCITSTDSGDAHPAGDHPKLPDCCTFGCSMASALIAPSPSDAVGVRLPYILPDVPTEPETIVLVRSQAHAPGSPRAPPRTV